MSDANDRTPTISLAYSVDADDAFMFHALRTGAIDTAELRFVHRRAHTAALNQLAIEGGADVVAVSVGVYPAIAARYQMLPHGASVGRGFGPVVVARRPLGPADLDSGRDHDRVAGAAADRAGRDRRRDSDLAVRRDLRRARQRRRGRRAVDPRRPDAVPRTRPAPGGRP